LSVPESNYKCPYCPYETSVRGMAFAHVRREHPNNDPFHFLDKMETTNESNFYAHIIPGHCKEHGDTAHECIHPAKTSQIEDLKVECLACRHMSQQMEGR